MQIIDGKALSNKIKDELKVKSLDFEKQFGRKISLAVVLVGDNPASQIYVKNKIKSAEYIGIKSLSYILPENTSQKEVEDLVLTLKNDDNVDGILVQLPLPKGLNADKILSLIPAEKDVDGFSDINLGKLLLFKDTVVSCTPKGILTMLKHENIELSGKNAVIIGRSNIVGKPLSLLLLRENCTVTVCHSKTKNLCKICSKADILISAIGSPLFVKKNMVKKGAVVIDVGINRLNGKTVGDVDFNNVKKKVSYISPVPGGVGPMTIASLMENTVDCAYKRVK